jgi:hypothetical protein
MINNPWYSDVAMGCVLCVGVAWCGVLWLLCREAWDGRGELASQKRKVEDRAAELEALR